MFETLSNAFSNVNWGDIGKGALDLIKSPDFLKGAGTLAGAWGQYTLGKDQAKMMNKQWDYQVAQDEYAKKKKEEAQAAINSAFAPATV